MNGSDRMKIGLGVIVRRRWAMKEFGEAVEVLRFSTFGKHIVCFAQ